MSHLTTTVLQSYWEELLVLQMKKLLTFVFVLSVILHTTFQTVFFFSGRRQVLVSPEKDRTVYGVEPCRITALE